MDNVTIDFKRITGSIKPMHAVNNGPIWTDGVEQVMENFTTFKEAQIPYVRNHDASFFVKYGGEHTVDVHAIFPDFNRDVEDETAYDFTYTDLYTSKIIEAGSKVFYRLGSKIEHGIKKYGTRVPADFSKWARICEHIIRHYNEGWADGFFYNIEYWEIWNEADGKKPNGDQPNWTGTPEEYYEMYTVAAKHLKKCFPNIKIGGPAISAVMEHEKWLDDFLSWIARENAPMDFFSWHGYTVDPYIFSEFAEIVRCKLDKAGFEKAENILNEWNYVEDWTDNFVNSVEAVKSARGASFTGAVMSLMQKKPTDMLMYYDARPGGLNGLFDTLSLRPLKGYFCIRMFSELYKLGNEVMSEVDENAMFVTAATNGSKVAAMVTRFAVDRNLVGKWVDIKLDGVGPDDKLRYYTVDLNYSMYERKAEIKDGVVRVWMEKDSLVLITNYCINE